jgi:hypothetical protein
VREIQETLRSRGRRFDLISFWVWRSEHGSIRVLQRFELVPMSDDADKDLAKPQLLSVTATAGLLDITTARVRLG